jgi:hypothetical protein
LELLAEIDAADGSSVIGLHFFKVDPLAIGYHALQVSAWPGRGGEENSLTVR